MPTIPVIIGSTRRGRQTPKVARFVMARMRMAGLWPEAVDLAELNLPVLEERLKYLPEPPEAVVRFGQIIGRCRAFVVVSPEYNGGCPGVLKNAIDYLNEQYEDKAVGIITVSSGPDGGGGCRELLTRVFTRLGAVPLGASFAVNKVQESFRDDGSTGAAEYVRAVDGFIAELRAKAGDRP
jgi:NAD(P)H-dependent FMN reductase